jgi:hypothetical protein
MALTREESEATGPCDKQKVTREREGEEGTHLELPLVSAQEIESLTRRDGVLRARAREIERVREIRAEERRVGPG